MQTTPKANNILGHFFALLGAVVMLAIATWVSASSSEQVKPIDDLSVPRTGHTATALSDGKILITGGRDADGNLVAASEIFDPETQTSSASASLNTARVDHSATVLADGRVLVAGGTGDSGALSSAEIFDPGNPDAGFQVVASPMTSARTGHTATLLNNGSVLIAGGETAGSAELFDPTTQTFSPTLWNLSVARSGHTATLFADDSVLLAGGNTDTMELFTPLDEKFTLDQTMLSVVRTGHWAFELSDTRLLLFQGDTGNSIDEFDPTSDTITPKGSLDFHASSSTLLANGKVLVLGTDVSGLYNPDAVPPSPDFTAFDETSVPNSGILPRSGQSAVTLSGDKKILITGGVDSDNQLLGQALFNPAKIWTDKDDYMPDEPVILSGSGWKANEPIYLFAVDNETEQWTYEMTVNADSNGEFILSPYFIVELRHLGVQFHVTAVGQSTMQAEVYFTDANPQSIAVGTQTPSPVVAGNSATYTVTVTFGGNQNACDLPLSISGLPAGASGSFSPATISFPNTQSTLTISTSPSTPGGTTTFTVTATRGANCQGNGNLTANGTLVVQGLAATTTTVTSSSNPSTYGDSVTFTATVTRTSGSGTPTGNVNFNIAGIGVVAGTPGGTTANTATWTYTTSLLSAGNHSVSASYVHTGLFQDSSGTLAGGQNVNQAPLTITANNQSKTYGIAFTFTGNEFTTGAGQLKNGDTVTSVTLTSSGAPATATVTGSPYSVVPSAAVFSPAGANSNYNVTYTNGSFIINAAPLTITANNQTKTYGTAFTFTGSEFSVGAGQLKNGDTVTSVTLTSGGAPAIATVAGSPYTIVPSAAVFAPAGAATNYSISYANGSFTVTAATLDITANNQSKTYGTAFTFIGNEFSVGAGQLKNSDTVSSVTLASAGAAATATVAGSPYTIVPSAAVFSPAAAATNYNIAYHNGSFTVNAATLTITANNQTKTYGTAFIFTDTEFTTSAMFNGDTVTSVTLSSAGAPATAQVAGSPYTITPSAAVFSPAAAATNYIVTYVDGSFTVNPAPLTITADNQAKTYGTAFTFTGSEFTTSGTLYNGDTVASVTLTSAGAPATATVAGSPYAIVPSAAVFSPAAAAANYSITYVDGSFTVNPAAMEITADNQTKTYGTAFTFTGSEFTITNGSLYNGDVVASVSLTSAGASALANVSGSPYAIVASAAVFTPAAAAGNYIVTYVDGSFTVTPATLTITADHQTKIYGQSDPPLTYQASGFQNGETAGDVLIGALTRAPGENVGTYAITQGTLAVTTTNYAISFSGNDLQINPAPLTITANNQSKTYGTAFSFTGTEFTTSGTLYFGDAVASVTLTSAGAPATATVAGSPYAIVPSAAVFVPAGAASNYNITYVNGSFTVTPASLTITATNRSKTYGTTYTPDTTDPSLDFSVSGLLNSDTVTSITLMSAGYVHTATVPGSPYTITPSAAVGTGLSNYSISYVNGSFTVNTATLTITATDRSKTYGTTYTPDTADPSPDFSVSGLLNSDTVVSIMLVSGGYVNTATVAGSPYAITPSAAVGTGLSNYSISYVNGAFTVNTATLTIDATDVTKIYGATYTPDTTPASPDFTVTGLLFGDSVTSITLTSDGYPAAALPGPHTVTPSAAVGTGLSNYTINYTDGTLTITYGTCTGSEPGGVILPPINTDGSSVYKRKAGSTIPVKFKVCDANGNSISDPNVVFQTGCCGSITLVSAVRGTVDNVNEMGINDIPDVAFRWTGDKWMFNMATTSVQAGYTYTFRINLKYGNIMFTIAMK